MEEFDKHYVWGYIVGASMLALGVFVLVPGIGEHRAGMIFAGAWYAVGGFGILRKTAYGVLMFYMAVFYTIWSLLQASTWARPNVGWAVLLLVWLGLPAIFYYRWFERVAAKRIAKWPDFNRKRKPVERPAIPTRSLSDAERKTVLEHIQERREKEL